MYDSIDLVENSKEYQILKSIYKRYTFNMFEGNEPYKKLENGVCIWKTRYGEGETLNDMILWFSFWVKPHIEIRIKDNTFWIIDTTKHKQGVIYEYCNKDLYNWYGDNSILKMHKSVVKKILNSQLLDCMIWETIRNRISKLLKENDNGF